MRACSSRSTTSKDTLVSISTWNVIFIQSQGTRSVAFSNDFDRCFESACRVSQTYSLYTLRWGSRKTSWNTIASLLAWRYPHVVGEGQEKFSEGIKKWLSS